MQLAELQAKIGQELGVSGWHVIDQNRIDAFADVTEDRQFIHVDPERAADTQFGGTIAHGFLSLSLLSSMLFEAVGDLGASGLSMNYGFESVRFLSAVGSGKRIRARFVLAQCEERKAGQFRLLLQSTVEIEGAEKPALVADWFVLLFA